MSQRVGFVWDERLAAYDFGPGHPLAPLRVQLAHRLMSDLGVLSHPNVAVLSPVLLADIEEVLRVHAVSYVQAVQRGSVDPAMSDPDHGLGTADNPVFPGMHEAALRICGASLMAARAVLTGELDHAVSIAGGLHHAMPSAAEGFCIYNDIGVTIGALLDSGVDRVAYVDVDVHHGDGVQAMFWNDPRVLTISLHESPATLFPGTGWASETGGPDAPGSAVNVALPAGTGDQGFLRALHGVVPDLLEAFEPQVLVTQQGVDMHVEDPLAHLTVSLDGLRLGMAALHRWAHQFADGRWVALGGGGYSWDNVVPRAWTHLVAEVAGHPIPPDTELPASFIDYVSHAHAARPPARMTDGRQPWPKPFDEGFSPEDPVDQAILATRRAVYPTWGLHFEPLGWF